MANVKDPDAVEVGDQTPKAKPSGKRSPKGDYDVGYCKTPESGKFKKGVSGNPKGRPKKKNMTSAEHAARLMSQKVAIGSVKMLPIELAFKANIRAAATGDMKAVRELYALQRLADAHKDQEAPLFDEETALGIVEMHDDILLGTKK